MLFISDGQGTQRPIERNNSFLSWALASSGKRELVLREMELLPLQASKAGLDLEVSYSLGSAFFSKSPNPNLAVGLLAVPIAERLGAP